MTIPAFTDAQLEALAKVFGDCFTGSDLDRLLQSANLAEPPDAPSTKWRRLLAVFQKSQAEHRVGNHVGAFIQIALEPARWHGNAVGLESALAQINEILAFAGLCVGEDGKLRTAQVAKTLSEAQQRVGRLRTELERRGVHPDVLRFCRAELLQENYFHAVLEATKSVGEKIRAKSGLDDDGAPLVDQAFGGDPTKLPILAFNALRTPTEWSEHRGLMNLVKGLFGAFRNPTAHEARISWPVGEADALDLLTLASLLHRRIDAAVKTAP
ncbi:MAG: TIGR02391 family protein [Candidatus Kerfeldbacteria bacterium]